MTDNIKGKYPFINIPLTPGEEVNIYQEEIEKNILKINQNHTNVTDLNVAELKRILLYIEQEKKWVLEQDNLAREIIKNEKLINQGLPRLYERFQDLLPVEKICLTELQHKTIHLKDRTNRSYHIQDIVYPKYKAYLKEQAENLLGQLDNNWHPLKRKNIGYYVTFLQVIIDKGYIKRKKLKPEIKDKIILATFNISGSHFKNNHQSKYPDIRTQFNEVIKNK